MDITLTRNLVDSGIFSMPESLHTLLLLVLFAREDGSVSLSSARITELAPISDVVLRLSLSDLQSRGFITVTGQQVHIHHLPDGMEQPVETKTQTKTQTDPINSCHSERSEESLVAPAHTSSAASPSSAQINTQHSALNIKSVKRFSPPSIDDVQSYITEKHYTFSAHDFIDYYESVGWVVGRTRKPMKNWRAACSTFQRNERASQPAPLPRRTMPGREPVSKKHFSSF